MIEDHTEYSLLETEFYIMALLYPGLPVCGRVFPSFMNQDLVYVGRLDVGKVDLNINVFHFSYSIGKSLMQERNMITFLKKTNRIRPRHEKVFSILKGDEFWNSLKLYLVSPSSLSTGQEVKKSIFNLFQTLFTSFSMSYKIFYEMKLNYKMVLSSLLTMMLKTENIQPGIQSAGYIRVLTKNKIYMSKFKQGMMDYLETKQREVDFIAFLFQMGTK